VAIKQSLMTAQQAIPLEEMAVKRNDLWLKFNQQPVGPTMLPDEPPEKEPALRAVNISLKTTEGMHHWLEASIDGPPPTAEEGGLGVFGHGGGARARGTQYWPARTPPPAAVGFSGARRQAVPASPQGDAARGGTGGPRQAPLDEPSGGRRSEVPRRHRAW